MKKIKTLALVMIFAFAALGGAYAALWKDSVYVNTTATTGTVELAWLNPVAGDDYHAGSPLILKDGEDSVAAFTNSGAANPNATDNPQAPGIRRDVAHISAALADVADGSQHPDSSYNNTINVTISNAYPDYQGEIEATLKNVGSVPVVIQKISDDLAAQGINWLEYKVVVDDATTYAEKEAVGSTPLLGTILEASQANGTKLDTKDPDATWGTISNEVKVRIHIHVKGGTGITIPEKTTKTFKITIDGVQWNGVNRFDSSLPTINLPDQIVNRFD